MSEKNRIRKRLLYNLEPIPSPPLKYSEDQAFDLEVRVIHHAKTLVEIHTVTNKFTVGNDDSADLLLDTSVYAEDLFDLVTSSGDGDGTLSLDKFHKGYIVEGEIQTDIGQFVESGKSSFDITYKNFAVLTFDNVTVVVLLTPKEKLIPAPFVSNLDVAAALILLISFILGFGFINYMVEIPPIELDITEIDNRFAELIIPEEAPEKEEKKEEKKVKLEKPKEGITKANTARRSVGSEGKVGKKDSKVANAQGSARRALDEKVANSSGIMGALSSGAQSFDRVFGGGGLGAGMEKTLGSVSGISGVDQFGSRGVGTRGFGMGGGGNALGIGGLGSKGRGGRGNGTSGYGMGKGKLAGKRRARLQLSKRAVVMGALDKAIIDRYIRRHLARIKWCYEKELNKDPKLFGKIVVNFIISKTGKVSSSKVKRTSMGNKSVESCVARQIKKIRFPQPRGGGIVIVNYPFVFKNSDS